MKKLYSILGAIIVFAAVTPSAYAENPEKIQISDFDLSTQIGVEKLYKRIAYNARRVCSPLLHGVSSNQRKYRLCVDETVALTITKSGLEPLATFHAAKSEKRQKVTVAD